MAAESAIMDFEQRGVGWVFAQGAGLQAHGGADGGGAECPAAPCRQERAGNVAREAQREQ